MSEHDQEIRKKFVKHIYKKIKETITGATVERVYSDKPQIQFFAGTLCSQVPSSNLGSIRTKVAPVRMGVEFLIKKSDVNNGSLKITPKASVFYRVNPTYQEQIDETMKKNEWDEETLRLNIKEQSELAKKEKENPNMGAKVVSVFKKYKMKTLELNCRLAELLKSGFEGQLELPETKQIIDDAFEAYNSDNNAYRPKKNKKDEMDTYIPLSVLADEKSFSDFMKDWGEKDADPSWDFKIYVKTAEFDEDKIKISVTIENTCIEKDNPYVDNFIFDTSLHVKADGAIIQDFVYDYLNDYYRYNGILGASGINCEALKDEKNNCVYSEHVPVFEQFRIKTRESIKPRFEDLASEKSISVLKEIAALMKEYLKKEYLQEYKRRDEKKEFKSELGKKRFQEDIIVFENEIKRFEYGIEVLEKKPLALKSFQMMNQTFFNTGKSKASEKTYDSWRIFQIVFIVMNLPDVISTEYKDVVSTFEKVEVLYFPTGGGKTETYLGLSIFTLFFDRMRGKKFGTSVMMKFPLRLLSLQQIQRVANVLAQAELIRRSEKSTNGKESEEFSLGYFVGDRNTPNKLINKSTIFGGEDKDLLTPIVEERKKILKGELKLNDETLEGRKYLIVSKCPFCGSKDIMIDADVSKIRLIHRCMNPECKEDYLPVYVSDMEIYRYLPSMVISTLDKIAICGLQKNFRNLFGQVTHKCPLHGYSNTSECTEKWLCKADKSKIEAVTPYDPVPTIQIQDEMHLVRESLGTFDSHYESFLENYEKQLTGGKRSMKILTATATIADYKMQTDHLYCKDAVQFPSQGPSLRESFYSKMDENDLNRLIIGITPHYKTMIFSVLAMIESYHRLIETYSKNPKLLLEEMEENLPEKQVLEILEDYRIMLSYHQAKNDGDSISNSIKTMSNRSLRSDKLAEIKQRTLTGDVSFNDVRLVLEEIENPKTDKERLNLIVATSMISHGVDVDKLNFMVFMGIPRNTAEYIQASSRVGRKSPGLVFVIFNPTRERDQSYFKFFTKFHEYKDLLVEAVPINRWAKFSINRTLPGIFSGAVLNYFDMKSMATLGKSINMSKPFEKAVNQGLITEEGIKEFILKSYKTDKETLGLGLEFQDIINKKVGSYMHEITQNLGNDFITKPMSEKPMTSLRDIDVAVDINLSPDGMMVLKNIKASHTSIFDEEEDDKGGDE